VAGHGLYSCLVSHLVDEPFFTFPLQLLFRKRQFSAYHDNMDTHVFRCAHRSIRTIHADRGEPIRSLNLKRIADILALKTKVTRG
jgi:hypothetical protein